MRILITGISGFVGSYLTEEILKNYPEYQISGLVRSQSDQNNIKKYQRQLRLFKGDILDYQSLVSVITASKPQWIFHLAAKIAPRYVKKTCESILETNVIGTLNLLKAAQDQAPGAKIFIASSASVYGIVPTNQLPIKENYPLQPIDVYGASKACSEIIGQQYCRTFGLKMIIARTFNLLAPARSQNFIETNLIPQINLIRQGKKTAIQTGNLNSWRDFLDARDAVKAYVKLMQKGQPGEVYNVCSGKIISLNQILTLLLQQAGLKQKIKIIRDPHLIRPIDIKKSLGDNKKLIQQTGWQPQIPLKQTLKDLLI